jgi:hypothetical protein
MAATNGHGRRWAVERCVKALQAPGVQPASEFINRQSALAMVSVARLIAERALP